MFSKDTLALKMEHHYSAYGLSIVSPIWFPELVAAPVPERIGAALVIRSQPPASTAQERGESYYIARDKAELYWPGIGHFTIEGGRQIVIIPAPDVASLSLRPYVLGPALAIALYQRDFTVLHCSAVALPDASGQMGVVAFLGRSGEGKSTLAAALHRAGYALFADDYLAIPPLKKGDQGTGKVEPQVYAGFPALRLGERSLQALEATPTNLPPLYEAPEAARSARQEARYVQTVAAAGTDRLPLRGLYVLQRNPVTESAVQSEVLSAGRAMPLLLQNLYCAGLLGSAETAQLFLRCGELAATVPVRVLRRPTDLSRLNESVTRVVRDALEDS